jgi:hypothetical protein
MTASHSDGFAGGVLAVLIAVLIVAGPTTLPAAAQEFLSGPGAADIGGPVRLGPPEEASGFVENKIDNTEADDTEKDEAAAPGSREPDASQASLGTGGGHELSPIERLLPTLAVETASPAMHGLLRRLLLTDTMTMADEAPNLGLLALRLERLLAMGEVDAVFTLLKALPLAKADERVAQRFVEALFYADDSARACTEVRKRIRRYRSAFWRQSFLFCQALAGETGQAMLGAEVLREEGTADDATFFTLIDAVMGDPEARPKARIASLIDPTPLQIAMLRAARQPLPEDAAGSTRPAVLRTLAASPNANREARLFAAERVAASGALPIQILIRLYEGFDFMPEQLAALGDGTELTPSPEGRAMLYQAVLARPNRVARAHLLQTSLQFARRHGGYWILIRALQAALLDIQPSTEFTWFAVDAARALYAGGRIREANAWYALLQAQAADEHTAAAAEIELWPLARIAGAAAVETPISGPLTRWREQWSAAAPEDAPKHTPERAALFYGLLAGLGEPLTANDWQALIRQGELATTVMPSATLWHALRAAAQEARVEETILFVLLSLGNAGPAAASPITLNSAITSLRLVGLEGEARALALEAAIDNGL